MARGRARPATGRRVVSSDRSGPATVARPEAGQNSPDGSMARPSGCARISRSGQGFSHVGPPCGNTDGATPRVEPPQFAGIGSLRLSDVPASVRLQAASRASRCSNAPSRFRPNARERLVRTPLGSGCTVARLQPCRGSPPSVAAICGRAKSRRELQFYFFWKRCSTGGFSKPTSQPHCRLFLFVIVPAPRGHCKMSGGARFPLP